MQIGWDGFAWMWVTQLCDSTLTLSSCVHSHYQDELWTWTNLCFSSCVSHCGGCTQCLVSVKTQHCHTATFNLHVGLITSRTAVKRAIIWLSSRGQSGSITPSVHDCWADLMLALCQFSTKNLVSCLHFKPAGHWHSQPGRSTEQMKSNIYVLHINHCLFRKKVSMIHENGESLCCGILLTQAPAPLPGSGCNAQLTSKVRVELLRLLSSELPLDIWGIFFLHRRTRCSWRLRSRTSPPRPCSWRRSRWSRPWCTMSLS